MLLNSSGFYLYVHVHLCTEYLEFSEYTNQDMDAVNVRDLQYSAEADDNFRLGEILNSRTQVEYWDKVLGLEHLHLCGDLHYVNSLQQH